MMKVKIERIVDEALDIRSFRLVRSDGQPLDTYEPGAHVDLTGPTGVTRQYSLCSPPQDRRAYLVAVKKDCLLYTSPSPRDGLLSRMPSSA